MKYLRADKINGRGRKTKTANCWRNSVGLAVGIGSGEKKVPCCQWSSLLHIFYIFEIFSLSGKQCKCNSFTFLWLSCFHNSLAGIQFCSSSFPRRDSLLCWIKKTKQKKLWNVTSHQCVSTYMKLNEIMYKRKLFLCSPQDVTSLRFHYVDEQWVRSNTHTHTHRGHSS